MIFARYGAGALVALAPHDLPHREEIDMDWRTSRPSLPEAPYPERLDVKQALAAPGGRIGDDDPPSILTAIKSQLGLELSSGKGPLKTVVSERIERSTENWFVHECLRHRRPQTYLCSYGDWSPSHDQRGMLRPFGTSSADRWYRAIVVVVAQAK